LSDTRPSLAEMINACVAVVKSLNTAAAHINNKNSCHPENRLLLPVINS